MLGPCRWSYASPCGKQVTPQLFSPGSSSFICHWWSCKWAKPSSKRLAPRSPLLCTGLLTNLYFLDLDCHAGLLGPAQRDHYTDLVAQMTVAYGKGDLPAALDTWDNITNGMFMDAGRFGLRCQHSFWGRICGWPCSISTINQVSWSLDIHTHILYMLRHGG